MKRKRRKENAGGNILTGWRRCRIAGSNRAGYDCLSADNCKADPEINDYMWGLQ
ncbi:hypothetical protein [Chitinophaga nivalis]|uniref:Uncharacterized protein n=1 Tax=Chitinophaga nivalis TaxID=2991709 RepID=A0ABT3ILJ9_9BACT|nr:hypothetical protein [Chitinophaga nivalis]MCW3465456.1 hypothetical protein [Chitinophaga nivalis]MCW3484852.1 hypothetical protein [Chitinophaga nivalis]